MQFNIRTLLGVTAAVALLCGVVFAAPPIVATPILIGLLWISPSLWINGIIYGRGGWRPFFIGGTIAGLVPHCASLYASVMLVASLLDGGEWSRMLQSGDRWPNLYAGATFLAPGPFSLLGGLVGVWTWWMFQPAKSALNSDERPSRVPAVDEYVIVSGRLTTAPIERQV
jgi:hypothetical protein